MITCLMLLLLAGAALGAPLGPPVPAVTIVQSAPKPGAPIVPTAPDPFAGLPRIDRAITPAEAVALAQKHSPVVAAMVADVAMAREMIAMAWARSRPMVSANLLGTYADAQMVVGSQPGVEPGSSTMVQGGLGFNAGLMGMVPLYNGGSVASRARAEQHRAAATADDLRAMRLDMALAVLTMTHRLAAMQAMRGVAEETVATNTERLRIDRAAQAAGRLPLANVLRDEAELATSQQAQANLERDVNVMLADLRAMLGVHPLSQLDIAPAEPLPATATTMAADLDAALRQRPELAALRSRLQATRADIDAVHGSALPQVSLLGMADLFANRMNAMGRYEDFTVGIGVGLPLTDGGMRGAQVRRGQADARRLTAQEQETALRIAREVSQARERIDAARRNVATTATAVTAAREDYRLMQLRYESGMATNMEVLDALRMRTMAGAGAVGAAQDLASATDELRRAIGDAGLLGERNP